MNEITNLITQSTIISMGWTKSMIKNLLPTPVEKQNPHYKCAAPMKLWDEKTVLQVMKTKAFEFQIKKVNKRKDASKIAIETKKNNLSRKMIDVADSINIEIIPDEKLIDLVLKAQEEKIKLSIYNAMCYYERLSCTSKEHFKEYEKLRNEYENYEFHRPNSETLNRWIVNYIRHNLICNIMDYSYILNENKSKIGKDEAYPVLKKEILKKILDAYPNYANECLRQIDEINAII